MSSTTLEELTRPELMDKSRMLRIAGGSGTTIKDGRELSTGYDRMRKLWENSDNRSAERLDRSVLRGEEKGVERGGETRQVVW